MSLQSQIVEDWTAPLRLTDTLSFNSNPVVVSLQDYIADETYMFYEKRQTLNDPTEIWWKKISDPSSEEQMLIGGFPEVNYRNPQIVFSDFLIFESNLNGNYDLFGVKVDENGLAGNIFQLTNAEQDENSFFAPSDYYSDLCCWERGGNIIAANIQQSQDTLIFINLDTIDSGDCFDPVCRNNFIAWRKIENNESHIYYSEISWPNFEWSDPDTIIQTNDNIKLTLSRTTPDFGGGYSLGWQSSDKIYFTDTGYGPFYISSPEIVGIEKYYEPTAFNIIMLVKAMPEMYSFAGETSNSRDIYIVDEFVSGYILNITEDTLFNKNPTLFSGRINWLYYEIINLWQTEINGYDVLFQSSAWYIATGGINEGEPFEVNISPNPVNKTQNIVISLPDNILIHNVQIYSATGNLVLEKKFRYQTSPYEINLKNNLPGLYFIKIQTSKGEIVRKLIKMK